MNKQIRLTLVQTSDLHGSLLPISYADRSPREIGLAKIATLLGRERERAATEGGLVMAIDNGDLIQGTPLAYHHARIDNGPADPMVLALNELSFDAAVVGNHEFNYGLPVLRKAMAESRFPWLSANIARAGTREPYFGQPYIVKRHAGATIAILGLTTSYIPNWERPEHIAGIDFLDAVETAKLWVRLLRERERADVVLVAYHGGFERDPETGEETEAQTGENQGWRLCAEVPGIDVLLTGHQHRPIAGRHIGGVAVVQPGQLGQYAGIVRLVLEREAEGDRWTLVSRETELLAAEGVPPDPKVVALAVPYETKTQWWLDTPIGKVEGDMTAGDPMRMRTADNAMIEFINRVQMEESGAAISCTALFSDDAPGFPPHVTMRHIVSNYVFPNTLKVIRVTGADIRAALERSATYFGLDAEGNISVHPRFLEPKPQPYNYDMWEGIEYVIDIARPEGSRVATLTRGGQPLDPGGEYDVVMNNYRAGGGGDYTMFQSKPVVKDIPTDVSELIANYILARGTVAAAVDGNWRVVAGATSPGR